MNSTEENLTLITNESNRVLYEAPDESGTKYWLYAFGGDNNMSCVLISGNDLDLIRELSYSIHSF